LLDTVSIEAYSTRLRILDASLALLTGGASGLVRMTDVAKAAGISRQALYLHFRTRTELLVATTLHLDQIKGRDARLAPVRAATTGKDRLRLWVRAWTGYIPEIHGLARALMAQAETDAEAAAAWATRMEDMRQGCHSAIELLARDGNLRPDLSQDRAADLLWMLLSIRNWEALCGDRGWSQADYAALMERMAFETLTTTHPAP
jgi:AcrR family transcriptional regulator